MKQFLVLALALSGAAFANANVGGSDSGPSYSAPGSSVVVTAPSTGFSNGSEAEYRGNGTIVTPAARHVGGTTVYPTPEEAAANCSSDYVNGYVYRVQGYYVWAGHYWQLAGYTCVPYDTPSHGG